jgi:ASC-1-like (ASCH) protein
MIDNKEIKIKIIEAGYIAVERLIKVAQEDIIKPGDDDELSADKLKNAAATKKLAIFDAFDILNRIIAERENIDMVESGPKKSDSKRGFAERRSK